MSQILLNRALALFVIWGAFWFIIDRKQADEQLRTSMQKLALHAEQTPLGVIEWNLNFEVTEWNPAAEKIFGFKQKETLGRHASFIVPESAREHVDEVWNELLNNRGGARSNNVNVTKDGRIIVCEWYNTPLIDTQNEVVGVASLVMDITERKQAESLIKENKERISLLLDSTAEAIYGLDLNGNCTFCNRACLRMLGYDKQDDLLGMNMHKLIHHTRVDGSPYPI